MSEEDKSQNTEEPTEKKLRDARKKGDVPQSRETGTAMVVFSLLVITIFLLPGIVVRLAGRFSAAIESAATTGIGTGSAGIADAGGWIEALAIGVGRDLVPVFAVMILAALFGVMVQGETVVALERIKPKVSKLNPFSGLKRMFSPDALVEFAKNAAKVLVVGGIALWVVRDLTASLAQTQGMLPESIVPAAQSAVRRILTMVVVLLVPVALADILWKRASWKKKQMMSLKQVRDEMKDSEGDPHIKGKRAELRMARARQRMAQAVPTASVILTNPTHYAVALRYEAGKDMAPVCVAKGTDRMAARIREIARENEVPIVENRPLARALHAVVEVDDPVPTEHWQAVAEIIGFVMDLAKNKRRAPPAGSELRRD